MTAITDTKLSDKLMKKKELELKKTIEMIKQNTYEKKSGKIFYRKHWYHTAKKKSKTSQNKKWKDETQD